MVIARSSRTSLQQAGADLPEWVYRFIRLGSSFARLNRNDRGDFLVLLVPIRSFAAVLLAAGMVLEDRLVRIKSTEQHFKWLCSLEPGTLLENGVREAEVVGVDKDRNQLLLQTVRPKRAQGPSRFPCHGSIENWLPKNSLRPASGSISDRLAMHLVSEGERWFISAEAEPSVVICGSRKTLLSEVVTPLLPTAAGESLESLLLVNQYQYQRNLRRVRVESRRGGKEQVLENPTERLVVYDGGRAFLNRSQDFRFTNQLLVLEYGDTDLTEAIDQVNQTWLDRVPDDDRSTVKLVNPPPGCEMAHFQVRV